MTEANWDATNGDVERDPEADRIVTEIEITRVDMGATIDEIGHRLQPQTIADEARDKIREATVGRVERIVDDAGQTATQTGNNLVSTIRQNPVPAALAGIGIGWLVMRMRSNSGTTGTSNGNGYNQRYGSYGYGQRYGGSYGQGAYGQGYEPRQGSYGQSSGAGPADAVRGAADQAASKAQEMGADMQYRAHDALDTVQQGERDVQYQAQSAMSDAQWQLDRTLNENPLALGALAVGVGAAVALAIPSTQKERELVGEQRDKLVEQAAGKVSEAMDQAQEKVQETSEQLTANSNG